MQSIAPAPVPQSMQNQDMSADAGIIPPSFLAPPGPAPSSNPFIRPMSHHAHLADMIPAPPPDLRAQLAAVINTNQQQHQHHGPGPHGFSDIQASSSASPHDHNIDPAIGCPGDMMSAGAGDSGGDDGLGDGRKGGKRELSQSKRAAQNRAAQRAFRQRKEGYIKKLEEQVRELHSLEDNFKAIQAENYSLREYIIHLQSRLIESQGDYPQPPPNINLSHPQSRHSRMEQDQRHDGLPAAPMAPMSQLQASAARTLAAAGLQSSKHAHDDHGFDHSKKYKDSASDDAASDEAIIRSQLQASSDGLPTPMTM